MHGPRFKDLTGQVFSSWTVLTEAGRNNWGTAMWLCRCICGKEAKVAGTALRNGATKSCGCSSSRRTRTPEEQKVYKNDRKTKKKARQASPEYKAWKRSYMRAYMKTQRDNHIGRTNSPEYACWENIKARCGNPSTPQWKYYGAKGVKVCQEWIDSFDAFFAYVGKRPQGTTLGRFGDAGNYEPGNCAWQTRAEQVLNRRNSTQIQTALPMAA